MKFESGVEGRESPFDGGRYSVALIFECCSLSLELIFECCSLSLELLFVADSTVETLSTENAELDLRHVEPAAMFWGVMKLQALGDASGLGRRVRLEVVSFV